MKLKDKKLLLSAMSKLYWNSRANQGTMLDHKIIGIAIISFASGAGIEIPDHFKEYEEERQLLAEVLDQAKKSMAILNARTEKMPTYDPLWFVDHL